jgi:prepilin-type N-terminal cleavage/methylation domain-containing protein
MRRCESGFSLLEMLVVIAVLSVVSAGVLEGVFRLTQVSGTVHNRTEMHAGVRNATELLQQEVGQAGRVALPNLVQLAGAVTGAMLNAPTAVTLQAVNASGTVLTTVNPTVGIFIGEQLVVDAGDKQETVTVTDVSTTNKTITASFVEVHAINTPVDARGGFAWGIVPPSTTNGSTGTSLKIVGDINSDGNLEYVEYTCDTTGGNLYRRSMAYDVSIKPGKTADTALLNNIAANPDGSACFTYQEKAAPNQAGISTKYVVDVAITLTVKTTDTDPLTGLYQTETKALLNVSPRNVFNVWQLAGQGVTNRVQPLPANVSTLIALP